MNRKTFVQLFQYAGVGGIGALVEWGGLALLLHFFNTIYYLLAVALSLAVAAAVNYLLSIKLVFVRGKYSLSKEVALIYLVTITGLIFNLVLMYLFVDKMKIPIMLSKIIATGIIFFWNFGARKAWVFLK